MSYWKKSREGYTESRDGRFRITPLYEGTTRAQSYKCEDTKTGRTWTGDTQRDLKWDVGNILRREEIGS